MSIAVSTRGVITDRIGSQITNYLFLWQQDIVAAASLTTLGDITGTDNVSYVNILPQYNLEEIAAFNDVQITSYPNGKEQRVATVNANRRQFNLKFTVLTSDEVDLLWQFYLDRHGPAYSFYYKNPRDSQVYTVRFSSKSMNRTLFAYQLESTGLQLIEVIGE